MSLLDTRDADNGFELVGISEAAMVENGNAIRSVCRDIRSFAKRDKGGDSAKTFSIVLCALQASGALGADEHDVDDGDDEALSPVMVFITQLMGWMLAVWDEHPAMCSAIAQIVIIAFVLLCGARCRRRVVPMPFRDGVSHGSQSPQVFDRPLNINTHVHQGQPAPGTPAMPLNLSESESVNSSLAGPASTAGSAATMFQC